MAKSLSPLKTENGVTSWDVHPNDKYLVTGVDRSLKRFRMESTNFSFLRHINLWRGTKWLIRNGKRFKISTVYN